MLLGILLFYVGSYVVPSVNGEMAYADLTLNITFPAGTVGPKPVTFPGSQRIPVAWQP